MKVIGVTQFGGPEQLKVLDVEEPHAGPGEVRLRVQAVTVNPTDTLLRAGAVPVDKVRAAPWIPGMDAAGVIDEVGDGEGAGDLPRWSVGDRVGAIVVPGARGGAYAQYVVVPAGSVARIPQDLPMPEASTILMNALTAHRTLAHLDLKPGNTLAVSGAAGAYGGFVIQLAKAAGLTVFADASEADTDLVRELGADVVVTRGARFVEEVRAAVPQGVDALADGALLLETGAGAVRDGGQIVTVRAWDEDPGRGISTVMVRVVQGAQDAEVLDELMRLVERGALTPRIAEVLPPERAAEAHQRLEAGGVRGRLVIDLSGWSASE